MAPPLVLDYLAAHEVAHLAEMNHSRRFWTLCKSLAPETETARAWLSSQGPALHAIGADEEARRSRRRPKPPPRPFRSVRPLRQAEEFDSIVVAEVPTFRHVLGDSEVARRHVRKELLKAAGRQHRRCCALASCR